MDGSTKNRFYKIQKWIWLNKRPRGPTGFYISIDFVLLDLDCLDEARCPFHTGEPAMS